MFLPLNEQEAGMGVGTREHHATWIGICSDNKEEDEDGDDDGCSYRITHQYDYNDYNLSLIYQKKSYMMMMICCFILCWFYNH